MEKFAELLKGIAAVITAAAFAFLLYLAAPTLIALSKRISYNDGASIRTIKISGIEVTLQEGTDQLVQVVNGLQTELAKITERVEKISPASAQQSSEKTAQQQPAVRAPKSLHMSVLWVNDAPRQDAYQIGRLTDDGVAVTTATSTARATAALQSKKFDAVVTDYTRMEDGRSNPNAALDLIKAVREVKRDLPVIIYTSPDTAEKRAVEARDLGVVITGSPVELEANLRKLGILN